jgi:hypothetical protein
MNSVNLTAAAISSLFLTNEFESSDQVLDYEIIEIAEKLRKRIRSNYPDILEKEAQGLLSYPDTLKVMEQVIEQDSEVAEVVMDLSRVIQSQPNQEIFLQVVDNILRSNLKVSQAGDNFFNFNFTQDGAWLEQKVGSDKVSMTNDPDRSENLIRVLTLISTICLGSAFYLINLLVFHAVTTEIQGFLIAIVSLLIIFSLSVFKQVLRF